MWGEKVDGTAWYRCRVRKQTVQGTRFYGSVSRRPCADDRLISEVESMMDTITASACAEREERQGDREGRERGGRRTERDRETER